MAEALYYIQNKGYCGNSLFWWKPARSGYCSDLKQAGKYTGDEVRSILCRPEDTAWLCSDIDPLVEHHVTHLPDNVEGTKWKVSR